MWASENGSSGRKISHRVNLNKKMVKKNSNRNISHRSEGCAISSAVLDILIDWIEFYAVSAIFRPCNGSVLVVLVRRETQGHTWIKELEVLYGSGALLPNFRDSLKWPSTFKRLHIVVTWYSGIVGFLVRCITFFSCDNS